MIPWYAILSWISYVHGMPMEYEITVSIVMMSSILVAVQEIVQMAVNTIMPQMSDMLNQFLFEL